jgi:hypothetical protein
MKTDEQDDLWRLLGHAKAPSVSPYFSRNVLRAIREEEQEKPGLLARIFAHHPWRWAVPGACAVLLAVFSLNFHRAKQATSQVAQVTPVDPVAVLAQQVSSSPDYQVINHLDELLASEETSVWLDK